jgi:hypothetical protein
MSLESRLPFSSSEASGPSGSVSAGTLAFVDIAELERSRALMQLEVIVRAPVEGTELGDERPRGHPIRTQVGRPTSSPYERDRRSHRPAHGGPSHLLALLPSASAAGHRHALRDRRLRAPGCFALGHEPPGSCIAHDRSLGHSRSPALLPEYRRDRVWSSGRTERLFALQQNLRYWLWTVR